MIWSWSCTSHPHAQLLFIIWGLCCLCNKLARHWSTPKTSHTRSRRDSAVYAVYAISSLDTGVPLRPHPKATIVGTYQGVAGLAPRLFTLEEETGSHHGHGHVHRTRMLICMHNRGSSLHLRPGAKTAQRKFTDTLVHDKGGAGPAAELWWSIIKHAPDDREPDSDLS